MKKAAVLLFTGFILGFPVMCCWMQYPEDSLMNLITPKVFDQPMVASLVSYGFQNALGTVLILMLFGLVILNEPISHLFIREHRTENRHGFEAKHFWLTLCLIPIFSLPFLWIFYRFGIFQIRMNLENIGQMGLQFIAMLFIHDTYFYWSHRLLHTRPFWKIHGVHHRVKDTTVLTSHVFHYVETFINYSFIVWFALGMGLLFGKIYYLPVMVFNLFTIAWNIYGHGQRNLFSENVTGSWLGRHIVWPSYHSTHHKKGYGNFQFFFTYWDEICGTRVA